MELRGSKGHEATFTASGNMNTDAFQFRFVQQSAGVNEDVYIATTSGSPNVVGVNQDKVLDNQHVQAVIDGLTKIRLASSLGAAIWLTTDAAGYAIQYTGQSGAACLGRLITGATSGTPGEMIFKQGPLTSSVAIV